MSYSVLNTAKSGGLILRNRQNLPDCPHVNCVVLQIGLTLMKRTKLLDGTPDISEIEKMGKTGKYPSDKVSGYKESRMQLERNMDEFPSERQRLLDEISILERRLKTLGWVE